MKTLLVFVTTLITLCITNSALAGAKEIKLLKKVKLQQNKRLNYEYSVNLSFDIQAPYEMQEFPHTTFQSDSCNLIFASQKEIVMPGVFTITEDKSERVKPFDILGNSQNKRIIFSENEDKSVLVDIKCFNESINPTKSFSISKINKIMKDYIELK